MHTRFQRCFGSQPSIIHQASALGFIHCVPPSQRVRCITWIEVRNVRERFGIPRLTFFCLEIFVLVQKLFFFHKKSHTLRFCIVWVGWLVSFDLVQLLGIYVRANRASSKATKLFLRK